MVRLDESQKAFIEAPERNIRLLASAGCGKTLCLLYRCKFLAKESPPRRNRFLIVTFTRAARDELRSRIAEDMEFAGLRGQIEISTLNSWGNRRIKSAADYSKLITSNDQYHFAMRNQLQPVWKHHEQIKRAIQRRSNYVPRILMKMIDEFKSMGFDHVRQSSSADFSNHWKELDRQGLEGSLEEKVDQLIQYEILEDRVTGFGANSRHSEVFDAWYGFWCEASQHLFDSATFTFEDQKYFAYQDERKNIEQGRLLSGAASYDHLFVDEFQDINPLDLALVQAIVERNRATLTIAGDDDQAIFEWRGATPEYILDPGQFFGSTFKTFTLGVNYRCPSNIVTLSQRLITNNRRRVPKKIAAHNARKAKIEIQEVASLSECLDYVNDLVSTSIAQGEKPSKIALIGRLKSQIIPYQIYFASKDIPFCAAEDLQIFLSETFDRLLRLLDIKAIADGRRRTRKVVDDILFMCNFVKRTPLSKKDRENLRGFLQISRPASILKGVENLAEYRGELKRTKNEEGRISIEMADAIHMFTNSISVSDALLSLSDNFRGLQKDFFKAEEDIFFKDPPFVQLAEYARQYGTDFDSFIDDIELAKATLVHLPPFEDDDSMDDLFRKPLHLMTAPRAKGKEFDKVVMIDVQDGIWPHKNADNPQKQEAERRVFYVAFTRAKEQVTMLLRNSAVPSPYIEELGLQA